MDHCPQCSRPYGERRRCYYCQPAKKRTGEVHRCEHCSGEFYVRRYVAEDKRGNHTGRYCSNACKYKAMKAMTPPWARPEDKTLHSAGYVLVWAPDHPRAKPRSKRVFEHILVAEKMLGRYLLPDERVHHKDGNRTNNDPSNLLVLTSSEHGKLHAAANAPVVAAKRPMLTCPECGKTFQVKPYQITSTDPKTRRVTCSRRCALKHRATVRREAASA